MPPPPVSESVAEAVDRHAFPPPGQLVDVGGRRLHIRCLGSGSPTVILESGSTVPSPAWASVQEPLAKATRVCAYDRAGYSWSDPADSPRTGEAVTTDLHTLLANADVPGPYILVAHSLGGLYARAFTARYPDEVVGLVLVDTRQEDLTAEMKRAGTPTDPGPATMRAMDSFNRLPVEQRRVLKAQFLKPTLLRAAVAEAEALSGLEDAVRASGSLGSRPLVVLAHGKDMFTPAQEAVWLAAQKKLAGLSTNSRFEVATESGHFIQADQPDLVIRAVTEMLR